MKVMILLVGVAMTAMGLLWVGQGLGYINWPASSFMISQTPWVYYGAMLALAGIIVMVIARRR